MEPSVTCKQSTLRLSDPVGTEMWASQTSLAKTTNCPIHVRAAESYLTPFVNTPAPWLSMMDLGDLCHPVYEEPKPVRLGTKIRPFKSGVSQILAVGDVDTID